MVVRSWRCCHRVWASTGSFPQVGQREARIASRWRTSRSRSWRSCSDGGSSVCGIRAGFGRRTAVGDPAESGVLAGADGGLGFAGSWSSAGGSVVEGALDGVRGTVKIAAISATVFSPAS
jgi:hypothetical protein